MGVESDRRIFELTAASAVAVLVSIAAAQILLVAACVFWLVARPKPIRWPNYFLPLTALMITTVLSLAFSPEPALGIWAVRKFWLFSMGLLAANFVSSETRARSVYRWLLGIAGATSLYGVIQFVIRERLFLTTGQLADDPTILNRITGSLGHWMTFGGEQLLVWCAAVPAIIILGRRWIVPLSAVGAAIILSFTRGVWIGAGAGLAAIALAVPRRLLITIIVPIVIIAAATSGLIYHRVSKSFEKQSEGVTARFEMLDVGLRMIRNHPLFGVGPERIRKEFPGYYRGSSLDTFYYGHLHNNFLQLAAERGLLCLAAFIWFLLELYRGLIGIFRRSDSSARWIPLSALAALTGFVVGGLTEYNFGDSEVLILLLFIVSVPFAVFPQYVQKNSHR
jgi:putative inorganic carbon (HCO3(-)) transporter